MTAFGTVPFGGAAFAGTTPAPGATGWDDTTLFVEVDFSQAVDDIGADVYSNADLWDVAVWDDTDYAWGEGTVWTDITAWVTGLTTSAKFSRDVRAFNASTLTFTLDNNDGRFSPDNTSSPYRIGASTAIGLLRPVRVWARRDGYDFPIFAGRIETWDDTYDQGFTSNVTVDAVDAFAELGAYDGYELTPAGSGDTYAERIDRILANAGYTGPRYVDPGSHTFQATTLAQNALSELKLVADSEGGAVWCGPDGAIYADGLEALITKARSNTVQATFTDTDVDTAIGYEMASTAAAYDASKVVNSAAFARVGSSVLVEDSLPSRALYGDRQATRTDLVCETDAQVRTLARREVAMWQAPHRRMESLRFSPMLQPSEARKAVAWDAIARQLIQLRSLVKVCRTPPGGYTLEKYQYVSGITHDIGVTSWNVRLDFAAADVVYSLVDSRWDVGVWDAAGWLW